MRRLSPDEAEELKDQAAVIGKIIEARRDQEIAPASRTEQAGVPQPALSRIEREETTDPRLRAILKILRPLGRQLAVISADTDAPGDEGGRLP